MKVIFKGRKFVVEKNDYSIADPITNTSSLTKQ